MNFKIKDTVYTILSPRQRVAATIQALARNDDADIKRLRETCPKQRSLATDDAYAETMSALLKVGLGVESDLRGLAIDYLAANAASGQETEHQAAIVRVFASIREAWRRQAWELQIDFDDLHSACGPRHDYVEALAKHAEGKHDEDSVEDFLAAIRAHFA